MNVTVPVGTGAGAGPPVTVAVSVMEPPSPTAGVAWVAMTAVGGVVVTDVSSGSLQAPLTGG